MTPLKKEDITTETTEITELINKLLKVSEHNLDWFDILFFSALSVVEAFFSRITYE
jgi:hypothetical protein